MAPRSLILVTPAGRVVNSQSGKPVPVPRGSRITPVQHDVILDGEGNPVLESNGQPLQVTPGMSASCPNLGMTQDSPSQLALFCIFGCMYVHGIFSHHILYLRCEETALVFGSCLAIVITHFALHPSLITDRMSLFQFMLLHLH